jgi:hypothetical protein
MLSLRANTATRYNTEDNISMLVSCKISSTNCTINLGVYNLTVFKLQINVPYRVESVRHMRNVTLVCQWVAQSILG